MPSSRRRSKNWVEIRGDEGRYGEIWEDMGRYGEQEDALETLVG